MPGHDDPCIAAFNAGLRSSLPRLYRYAAHLCRSREAASDAVQDAVLRALERRESYDPGRPLLPWLLTLVRHAVVDRARSFDPFRRSADLDLIPPQESGAGSDPARAAATVQAAARIQAALERLPLEQRSSVVLFYLEGMTLDEIATIEDVAVGTVKSRLHRAREALVSLLGPEADGVLLWN